MQKNFGSTRGGRLLDVYIRIQGKILNDGFCLLSTSNLFFRVRCLISGDDAAYDQDNQERQLFLAIRLFFFFFLIIEWVRWCKDNKKGGRVNPTAF